jgi:hypothetical protein
MRICAVGAKPWWLDGARLDLWANDLKVPLLWALEGSGIGIDKLGHRL